jgi:hypothetical protein
MILRPHLRVWLGASLVIVLLVLGYRGVRNMRPSDPHAPLHDSIAHLRVVADSCRFEVDAGVAGLREFNRTLDSLRTIVRDYEALDERGVPIDSYSVYMDAFTMYNDSAAAWSAREDTVRARDARCRVVVERHNTLADSLRVILTKAAARRR